jgi:hypothetical protein
MTTLAPASREDTALALRLREMAARGNVLAELDAVEDVARELRIAAEETLDVTDLALYVRRRGGGTLSRVVSAAETRLFPNLVRQAARSPRPVRDHGGDSEPNGRGTAWAFPLRIGDRLVGVATAVLPVNPSRDPARCEGICDLLGVLLSVSTHAVERTLLLEDREVERQLSRNRSFNLGLVHDLFRLLLTPETPAGFLQQVAEGVREGAGFRLVLIRVYDRRRGGYVARASSGLPREATAQCFERVVGRDEIAPLFTPKYRLGRSYFVSHRSPLWDGREDRVFVPDLGPRAEGEWQANDCLLVPIDGGNGDRLGYMSVDDPVDRQPPSQEKCATLEIYADLVSLGLERLKGESGEGGKS